MMRMATLVLCAAVAAAQPAKASDDGLPHVSVYGTAVKEITPDILRWRISVRNKGAELEDVAKEHTDYVSQVLKFLKDKGVKEEDTQTADMRFGENWEYRNNSRVKSGYIATTEISFKMTELAKYRDVWIGLAAIKQVDIDSVTLDASNRIAVQNETRQKALLAAREKARAMAKTLGAEIGEPLAVDEVQNPADAWSSSSLSNSLSADAFAGGAGGEALSPGRIPVKVRVKVSFRLVAN